LGWSRPPSRCVRFFPYDRPRSSSPPPPFPMLLFGGSNFPPPAIRFFFPPVVWLLSVLVVFFFSSRAVLEPGARAQPNCTMFFSLDRPRFFRLRFFPSLLIRSFVVERAVLSPSLSFFFLFCPLKEPFTLRDRLLSPIVLFFSPHHRGFLLFGGAVLSGFLSEQSPPPKMKVFRFVPPQQAKTPPIPLYAVHWPILNFRLSMASLFCKE